MTDTENQANNELLVALLESTAEQDMPTIVVSEHTHRYLLSSNIAPAEHPLFSAVEHLLNNPNLVMLINAVQSLDLNDVNILSIIATAAVMKTDVPSVVH